MNNSFNGWETIATNDLDSVANYILTGKKALEFCSDSWLISHIGSTLKELNILDFGCGIGRNIFGLATASSKWNVIGYDNVNMIEKSKEFKSLKYNNVNTPNASFNSNWSEVKNTKFDIILCILVLQHIHEKYLNEYLTDFKSMTHKLIVSGRRFNDDMSTGEYKNTWQILENNDLFPRKCIGTTKEYSKSGDPGEHFSCIYEW